jgi:hypothetical protein
MTRERLPARRNAATFEVVHGRHLYDVTAGFYDDGRVGEVFVTPRLKIKSGDLLEAVARDSAILLSLALQHGCPIETIRTALTRDERGEPAGPIGEICDELAGIRIEALPAAPSGEGAR